MALTDSLCFDIVGSLITSQGIIPTFLRYSPANADGSVNGSWRVFASAAHQPRFTSTGALLLEQGANNLLTYPQDLTHSSWVKGSSLSVLPDRIQGLDNNYKADLLNIGVYTGNTDAQTMTKTFTFGSALTFTVSYYLNLLGGRFGPNDALKITGDVAAVQTTTLGSIFNDRPGNYIPVVQTFTTAGSRPATYQTNDTQRAVNLQLYCEKAVSLAWGGAQLEVGSMYTTFIDQDAQTKTRDKDYLNYSKSPVEGLSSFLFYVNLERWRGDGVILDAGNFRVEIAGGKIKVTAGTVSTTDPDALPASAKIAVRVSKGLEKLQLYVNGVLKTKSQLTGYSANTSSVTIGGEGMRQIRCLYFFNRDIGDGSVDIGQTVLSDLLLLHQQDSLLTDLAEGHSRIIFPYVTIPAGGDKSIRFPQSQRARQTISAIATGTGAVAQVEKVTVQTIVNAAAVQTDTVIVNGSTYPSVSDNTPTQAEQASALATKINTGPKPQAVTAAYTAGNAFFTVTADVAGTDFALTVSPNLIRENVTPNGLGQSTITVSNAVDYQVGKAQLYRNYAYICDIAIISINTSTNQLVISTIPNTQLSQLAVGDVLIQSSWDLKIGPNNYFVHHLEDYPDIKPAGKTPEGFRLKNTGIQDRVVTPHCKVVL